MSQLNNLVRKSMSNLQSKSALLLLLLVCIGISSCNEGTCKLPDGNYTSEILAIAAREKNCNYCTLLDSAINGDNNSIKRLALLDFSDAVGYDHGAVLIEVINKIGDAKFTNAITTTSKDQRITIESYLEVGLEYGYRKEYADKSLKEIYPKLYYFLNE